VSRSVTIEGAGQASTIVDGGGNGRVIDVGPGLYSDTGPADTHTATINWGDGNSETIAIARHNLGRALVALGRTAEGERYLRASLETRRAVLGADHPDVCFFRYLRSSVYRGPACQFSTTVNGRVRGSAIGIATRKRWPSGATS